MPTNKNASIRYQALDKCFRDRRHRYYIDDLIDKCEEALYYYNGVGGVSRRQVFEDIKFMESDTGWSIPLERKKDGKKVYYRYEDPDFSINEQPLTDEEAQQLRTVILTLSRFRGLPSNEWIEDVISNLEWRFNLKGKSENIIGFEQNANLKGLNWLTPILDATSNHQPLKIVYRNYKNSEVEKTLIVHPWYVKQYNNRWFLFALDDQRYYITNLALDRIQSLEISEDTPFMPNENINFEEYFNDVIGVTIPKDDVVKIRIVLKFSKAQFPYITSKPLHQSQAIISEDDCTLAIEVRPTYELDQLILSFGPDIEVLEPTEYREYIKRKIEENLQKYLPMQKDCFKFAPNNINMKENSPYTAAITGGGFLFTETNALLPLLQSADREALLKDEKLNNRLLKINAETSRYRAIAEIARRYDAMPASFWEDYMAMNEDDQQVALFFVILKTYKICFDFHINVTMRKWNSINKSLVYDDIEMEFNEVSARDEFVDSWSDKTKRKVASAYLTVLRKVGILDKEDNLHPLSASNFDYYITNGEQWFLEACLLQPYQIDNIKKKLA